MSNNDNDDHDGTVYFSTGSLWLVGWLFAIGFSDLSFGRAILALLVWPYYVGDTSGEFVR